jgi:F5/8 type C domain
LVFNFRFSLLSLVIPVTLGLVLGFACAPDPVQKGDSTMNINVGGDAGMGSAGAAGTGAAGTSTMTSGDGGTTATAGTSGAAGTTAAAGTSGTAGTGAAGTTAAAGTSGAGVAGTTGGAAGTGAAGTGAAGTAAAGTSGGAGTTSVPDAGVDAPPPNPCDHTTWTFVPSVVCTTTCAAMAVSQKDPANAIDGNPATRYTTGITQGSKGPETATLTFHSPVSITGVTLLSKGGDGPFMYQVDSSTDGVTFNAFVPPAVGAGSDTLTVPFERTFMRAIRITQTGVKKTNWWSIHELTVIGCQAAQ